MSFVRQVDSSKFPHAYRFCRLLFRKPLFGLKGSFRFPVFPVGTYEPPMDQVADGPGDFARGLSASSSEARALALERHGARIPTRRPARPRRREMTPRSSPSLSFRVEGRAGSDDKLCACACCLVAALD